MGLFMGLTIITVVKDDPLGLDATLASIDRQSVNAQVIVMDGGSGKDTIDVAHKWQQSLSMELHSEPDHGPYDAMNRALTLLDGNDLVWFVNAGDTLRRSDALERAKVLTRDPEFTWGFGPHCVLETTGEFRRIETGRPYSLTNHAYGKTPICHQAVIARVSCLRQIGGFDLRYPIAADYRSLLLLGKQWQPKHWDDVLVEYRAGGISDRHLSATIREQGRVRREVLQPYGRSRILDHLYDTRRLLRHGARQVLVRGGINPTQLTSLSRTNTKVLDP